MQVQALGTAQVDDLLELLAHSAKTDRQMIDLFSDVTSHLSAILKLKYQAGCRLVCAGHVTPDIEIAADMAEVSLVEVIPPSPFSGNTEAILERIENPFDFVYVANPNRVTGANYSLAELERLAGAVPNGLVIVDEYFFDYFGITAAQLLNLYTNVVVIRSFTASFGIYSADSGYVLAPAELIRSIKESTRPSVISPIVRKTIFAVLTNRGILEQRLAEIHEESLRVTNALAKLGVQSRITATDFLLMRVASPKDVGNFLAGYKISVENLDGYPQMRNYLRYRIQSPLSNDKFLKAIEQMPRQYYSMRTQDRRRLSLQRGAEAAKTPDTDRTVTRLLEGAVKERNRSVKIAQKA